MDTDRARPSGSGMRNVRMCGPFSFHFNFITLPLHPETQIHEHELYKEKYPCYCPMHRVSERDVPSFPAVPELQPRRPVSAVPPRMLPLGSCRANYWGYRGNSFFCPIWPFDLLLDEYYYYGFHFVIIDYE